MDWLGHNWRAGKVACKVALRSWSFVGWGNLLEVGVDVRVEHKRLLLAAYAAGIVAMSVYSLVFFLQNKVYLIGSDTFYYMSIGDSIVQSGSVLDITAIPAQPLKTPQNGIVLLYTILSALKVAPESRLVTIVVINYILHLSAMYPLYRIARRIGLEGDLPMGALLAVYAGAWHIYRLQLIPINDGVFNVLAMWLAYLIVMFLQDYPGPQESRASSQVRSWSLLIPAMIVLSALLIHFRLQAGLVLGAGLLAALITARFRQAAWLLVCLIVSMVSLVLPYALVISIDRMSGLSEWVVSGILDPHTIAARMFTLVDSVLPELLFVNAGTRSNLMYGVFALALLVALIQGLRKREAGALFIALSCSAAILFVAFFIYQTHRLAVYVFPFLYLFLLRPSQMRPIGYMFVALVLISSLGSLAIGFNRVPASQYWLYLHQQHVTLPDDEPLLISQSPRHSYFILGTRAFRDELTWDVIVAQDGLFLLGDERFVSTRLVKIGDMAESAHFMFERRNLTPDYHGAEGHVLLHLYDLAPKEE